MFVKEEIVQKLEHLPEPKLQEVLSFVDFLIWKGNESEEDQVLKVAGTLSGIALSAEEIEQALYGDAEAR